MKKFFVAIFLSMATQILHANQYNYLLFSDVLSDIESGLQLKADVNANLMHTTPLRYAVSHNNLDIAYILLNAGADVNANINGQSALHIATKVGNVAMAKLLLNAGADVNAKDSPYGNTPLHYASYNNDLRMISLLNHSKGDMKIVNNSGVTPAQIMLVNVVVPPVVVEDMNVAISASAFRVNRGSVVFNVRNLTNHPLTIVYIRLYVNGTLSGESRSLLNIPPSTTVTNASIMVVLPNAIYALKPNDNGLLDMKAGFSVGYTTNEGYIQEAFNSLQLPMKLWDAPQSNTNSTNRNANK